MFYMHMEETLITRTAHHSVNRHLQMIPWQSAVGNPRLGPVACESMFSRSTTHSIQAGQNPFSSDNEITGAKWIPEVT